MVVVVVFKEDVNKVQLKAAMTDVKGLILYVVGRFLLLPVKENKKYCKGTSILICYM